MGGWGIVLSCQACFAIEQHTFSLQQLHAARLVFMFAVTGTPQAVELRPSWAGQYNAWLLNTIDAERHSLFFFFSLHSDPFPVACGEEHAELTQTVCMQGTPMLHALPQKG